MGQKVDILAVGVHPDDIELSCSGTLLKHIDQGYSAALCDLTQGELGTRGSAAIRLQEAERARNVFGIQHRSNLGLPDGFLQEDKSSLLKLIEIIRRHRPEIVLANAVRDRHPDHGRSATFIQRACFLAGLIKIETRYRDSLQDAWRPKAVYHYIQDYFIEPDFVVDITDFIDRKLETIQAYSSQFFDPNSTEPETPISTKAFLDGLIGRARQYGRLINTQYGEGFTVNRPVGVQDLLVLD